MTENYTFLAEGNVLRLRNSEIFDGLGNPKIYEKGQIICLQGDEASHVYYLKTGKVQIYVASPSGAEKILTIFSGGNLFGKSAFFDKKPRASCAKTLAKSEIIQIDRPMMIDIISEHPQFAMDMMEYLSKTIRLFSNQIENMSFLKADKRTARFIIANISEDAGNPGAAFSHDEISGAIGVSRVTVSKILGGFARNGWIDTEYRRVKVIDVKALREFAFEES